MKSCKVVKRANGPCIAEGTSHWSTGARVEGKRVEG